MIFEMERERGAVKTHAAPPKKERRSRSRSEFQKRAALQLPLRNFGAPLRSAAPPTSAFTIEPLIQSNYSVEVVALNCWCCNR